MAEMIVSYEGTLRCSATHEASGATIVTDAPKDHHGKGEGFSPSDLLSVSLGGCILSVMGIAAQSLGLDVAGTTAAITKEMAGNPRRIAKMSVAVHMSIAATPELQEKLEAAAHSCPVHQALGIDVPISIHWNAGPLS